MNKIKTISGNELSKIGIGTYGIGGLSHRFNQNLASLSDDKYIEALVTQLNLGMNFTEISVALAQGKSAKLLASAIKQSKIKREELFVTHSLWPKDLNNLDDVIRDIEVAHKIFETEMVDSTLVTLSLLQKFGKDKILELLHHLLETKKSRYVSLSNSNLATIELFASEFGEKFVAHEAHVSFEIRENCDEGILDLCKKLGVRNNIWRSLRQGKTVSHNWELLVELAKKYNKTQSQIVLNWLIKSEYFPMVFSANTDHIIENFESQNFEMEEADMEKMDNFRVANYRKPKVDWDKTGDGISVALLPDVFEENLDTK